MKTSSEISYGLYDVNAKSDLTATANDKQSFIDLSDLKLDGVTAPSVATGEYKYWKLDKSFATFPDKPDLITWGYWSNSMTETGKSTFKIPPVLTLSFSELHSAIGLSFEFNPYGNDYCNDLKIQWYRNNALIVEKRFTPNRWNYSASEKVENFNKIIVTFYSMNKPDRYLKLQSIIFGVIKIFPPEQIENCYIEEEADLTGETIPMNTMNFDVMSDNNDFDILNPKGIFSLLTKKQQLQVSGFFNGKRTLLGTFFVDKWETDATNKRMKFKTIDAIGIMDSTLFKGGMYVNKKASEVIDEIMTDAGFGYNLESSLGDELINGYIPIDLSHREALTMVAMSLNAYVDTSRLGVVQIKKSPLLNQAIDFHITDERKADKSVKRDKYISGVEVTAYHYSTNRSGSAKEIFKGTLEAGVKMIKFSAPVEKDTINVSGATIIERHVNFCKVNVTSASEVVVTGYEYVESEQIFSVKAADILAGEKEAIKKITGNYLINNSNALKVAQQVYDFAQLRILQKFDLIPEKGAEIVGSLLGITTPYEIDRLAVIEKIKIDVGNGIVPEISTKGV